MRLHRCKITGFGPFRSGFEFDLDAMGDARIINVAGPNGSGKSTSLELAIAGAAYRVCPTRGRLASLAVSRDATLESQLSHNGKRFTVRHVVDGVNGKAEALLLDEAGEPIGGTTKVKDFDAWAAANLPAPEVLFASTFGAQASGGFLSAKPTERKSILLRSLGLEQWERWAEQARERAKETKLSLATVAGKLEQLDGMLTVETAQADLDEADAAERTTKTESEAKQLALDALRETERIAREAKQAHATALERKGAVAALRDLHKAERAKIDTRITNNEAVRRDAEKIRKAAAQLTELATERAAVSEQSAKDHGMLAALGAELTHVEREARAIEQASERLQKQVELFVFGETDRLRKQLQEHRDLTSGLPRRIRELEIDIETLEGRLGTSRRVHELRNALEEIEAKADPTLARPALNADDALALDESDVPARLAIARELVACARRDADDARRKENQLEHALRDADQRAADRDRISTELTELNAKHEELLVHRSDPLHDQVAALEPRYAAATKRIAEIDAETEQLQPLAKRLAPLEHAEARLAELRAERAECDAAIAQATADLEAATVAADDAAKRLIPEPDLGPATRAASEAQRAWATATAQLAIARERHEQAVKHAEQLVALRKEQHDLDAELSDWVRLSSELGKDGIQAAEIDGALGELNELTNDLLHECHGPRWTVRIDTQKLSGDGKRLLESLDVTIIDTVSGREAAAETFSGGERAILGEAVALALTMVACRRAGFSAPTLVRDESGAALDPANARVYVSMLRRAADYVGASHVLVVSHQPEIAELCDATIDVTQSPPGDQLPLAAE